MVFHLFERIFSPDNLKIDFDSRTNRLIAEGFSHEEANNIAWLMAHSNDGKKLGLVVGACTVYGLRNYLNQASHSFLPRLRYQKWARNSLNLFIIFGAYKLGDYLFTSRRYGANYKVSNAIPLVGNRFYIDNKESFIQNFEPLNRKFTQEEIDLFLVNDKNRAPRKWIYNPYLHGDDEQAWRNQIENVQKSAPWQLVNIRAKIRDQNKEKINVGEEIQYRPFQPLDFIDVSGKKLGLQQNPFTTKWQVI